MVKRSVIDTALSHPRLFVGFALKEEGGTVRYLAHLARQLEPDVTVQDVLDSLRQMLADGTLEPAGAEYARFNLYRVKPLLPGEIDL